MDIELVKGSKTKAEGSSKRAREELESDNSKKQRIDEHVEAKRDDDQEEDLETLWKLVKAKHGNTRPEEVYERVLLGDLKVMFEPDVESEIWKNLQVSVAYTKVNAIGMKVTTAERLQLLEEFLLSEG
ncbi:hypothetical protein Tco_0262223 [Tanacetum coccineum]